MFGIRCRHRRPALLFLLLAVAGGCHGSPSSSSAANAAASRAIPVAVEPARTGDIGSYLEALGTVTPLRTVTVLSRVQGQIMRVYYREGQLVKRGEPLLDVDARPYEAALLQAKGSLARDVAALAEARIDLARYRRAYAHRAIPKQQLDDQEQLVHQDEGAVLADRGTVLLAQANLAYCHITAPADGRVGLRLVDAGNIVQANSATPLVVVTQTQPISVVFSLAEDFLPQIQAGARDHPPMEVDAYDRAEERKLATGAFLTLDNQVDPTTGTVKLRAIFDNADSALFPQEFVNARLLVSTRHGATLIAAQAIQHGAQGTFVYVVDPAKKTAALRAVKVGTIEAGSASVEGVRAGEDIATAGFDKLEDGAKVAVEPGTGSLANEPGTGSPATTPAGAAHQMAGTVSPAPSPAPPAPEPK